jgi:amino-acid N-acetyltransferase
MTIHIDRATAADFDAVTKLLGANHLPLDGLREHFATAVVARDGDEIVGSAALEIYADGALLRSVAVARPRRNDGIGAAVTVAALQLARELGAPAIYLLTTTAEEYFPRFGFERIERAAVPAGVQASVEFTSACPSSATVMRKASSRG